MFSWRRSAGTTPLSSTIDTVRRFSLSSSRN
jgi:hypothetical protein